MHKLHSVLLKTATLFAFLLFIVQSDSGVSFSKKAEKYEH